MWWHFSFQCHPGQIHGGSILNKDTQTYRLTSNSSEEDTEAFSGKTRDQEQVFACLPSNTYLRDILFLIHMAADPRSEGTTNSL